MSNFIQKFMVVGLMSFLLVAGFTQMAQAVDYQSYSNTDIGPDLGTEYPKVVGLSTTDPRIVAAKVVRAALGVLGVVCVIIMVYAGVLWMTAGGNDEKITEAKKWVYGSIIGLALILASLALTTFVITELSNAFVAGDAATVY